MKIIKRGTLIEEVEWPDSHEAKCLWCNTIFSCETNECNRIRSYCTNLLSVKCPVCEEIVIVADKSWQPNVVK